MIALCAATAWPAAAIAEDPVVLHGHDVPFRSSPPSLPPGPRVSVLYGNPGAPEMFVLRMKLPAGYRLPPHRHERHEIVTVISGTFHLGLGEDGDRARTTPLAAGGFFAVPPGMAHYGYTDEETVIQLNTIGPGGIAYVDPADDPRR
ncbi:MAG: cupin domain-containing protein [Sphingomonas sp.]|nr:cupin domain-containing protein [Sphingomonas sp.]